MPTTAVWLNKSHPLWSYTWSTTKSHLQAGRQVDCSRKFKGTKN
jgi:hypothetical protein